MGDKIIKLKESLKLGWKYTTVGYIVPLVLIGICVGVGFCRHTDFSKETNLMIAVCVIIIAYWLLLTVVFLKEMYYENEFKLLHLEKNINVKTSKNVNIKTETYSDVALKSSEEVNVTETETKVDEES